MNANRVGAHPANPWWMWGWLAPCPCDLVRCLARSRAMSAIAAMTAISSGWLLMA